MSPQKGFTLTDVVMGTLITSVVVTGTMSAFITAARIHRVQNGPMYAEAAGYAQDLLEAVRNQVAMDPATNTPNKWFSDRRQTAPQPWASWKDGDDPRIDPATPGTIKRKYLVQQQDCDNVAGLDNCYSVTVKVCWNDPVNCP